MKYIGRVAEYIIDDEKRIFTIKKIEFHQLLGKPVFTGTSPFGNTVRLSRDEIHKIR